MLQQKSASIQSRMSLSKFRGDSIYFFNSLARAAKDVVPLHIEDGAAAAPAAAAGALQGSAAGLASFYALGPLTLRFCKFLQT